MPTLLTTSLPPLSSLESLQVYCGLDNCLTLEISEVLQTRFPVLPDCYSFALAMQAPALDMMLRGWRIDPIERDRAVRILTAKLARLDLIIQRYAIAIWDKHLNPRSPKQMLDFLYGAMALPEQWISIKGQRKLSTNREVLEKLEIYFHARPVVAAILAYRDVAKQLSILQTSIDSDGRWRTSYNIGGTETGRWSSSGSAEGTGSNIQNIPPGLRGMFVADPGWVLVGIDLEQTESRDVGWLQGTILGDWTYLDAVEAGDIHTVVTRLVWPDMPWTGDLRLDKAIADNREKPFYREYTHRDMAKRGGHLSNYKGSAFTASRFLKVPLELMEFFQASYLRAFPGFEKWWTWVATQVQTTSHLVTPFGRERTFFGRPNDDTTLREAIAYVPQSSTADRLNLGLWRIWKHMGTEVQLLGQVHDAVYFQVPEKSDLSTIITRALALLETPLHHSPTGRTLVVPGEAKWGWNWASLGPSNPDGLAKWKGKVDRQRTSILNQRL